MAGPRWGECVGLNRDEVDLVALGPSNDSVASGVDLADAGPTGSGRRPTSLVWCSLSWLVSDSVPINEVQQVFGHERASTTLDRYTHATTGHDDKVRAVFAWSADGLLTFDAS